MEESWGRGRDWEDLRGIDLRSDIGYRISDIRFRFRLFRSNQWLTFDFRRFVCCIDLFSFPAFVIPDDFLSFPTFVNSGFCHFRRLFLTFWDFLISGFRNFRRNDFDRVLQIDYPTSNVRCHLLLLTVFRLLPNVIFFS